MKKYIVTVSELTDNQESQLLNIKDIPESSGKTGADDNNMNTSPNKLLLSPAEAAEMMGIGRTKIYELIHIKGFPSFRLGGRVVISYDGLREWIREQVSLDL